MMIPGKITPHAGNGIGGGSSRLQWAIPAWATPMGEAQHAQRRHRRRDAGAPRPVRWSMTATRRRGRGRGHSAGAMAGGAIGAATSISRTRDLRAHLGNDDIRIQNTGEELIVTMPEDILFDIDSAAIRASLQSDLRALARNLQQYPNTTVDVIGHTDNTGSAQLQSGPVRASRAGRGGRLDQFRCSERPYPHLRRGRRSAHRIEPDTGRPGTEPSRRDRDRSQQLIRKDRLTEQTTPRLIGGAFCMMQAGFRRA